MPTFSRRSATLWLAAILAFSLFTGSFAAYPHPHQGPFPDTECSSNDDCKFDFGLTYATQMVCESGVCKCPASDGSKVYNFNYYTGHCDLQKGIDSKGSCSGECELSPYTSKSTCETTSKKCLCNAGFTLNSKHNVCVRKYGEVCDIGVKEGEKDSECWVQDEFFSCARKSDSEPYRCGCYEPYIYDATTNSCVFEMHKTCRKNSPSWEPQCQGGFYSECAGESKDGTGTCQCQAGFTLEPTSKTCIKTMGQSCSMRSVSKPEECNQRSLLECRNDGGGRNSVAVTACQCRTGYEPDNKAGGVCRARSGAECVSSKDCKKDFFCSAEGKCVCPKVLVDGMCGCPEGQEIWEYAGQPSKCRVKSGGACSDGAPCDANAQCSSSRCSCLPGASNVNGFCFFGHEATVPDTVASATACAPTFTYQNGKCICNGVYDKFRLVCVPNNGEVSNCADNSDCENIVAHCVTPTSGVKRCECKEGYKVKGGNCTGGIYGRACDADSQCDGLVGLGCLRGSCQCKSLNYAVVNGKCVVRAGRKCNMKVDVCEPDFTCSTAGTCVCSTESKGNGVCPRSDMDDSGQVVIDVNAYSSFILYSFIVLAGIVLCAIVIGVILLKGAIERSQRHWALCIIESVRISIINSRRRSCAFPVMYKA